MGIASCRFLKCGLDLTVYSFFVLYRVSVVLQYPYLCLSAFATRFYVFCFYRVSHFWQAELQWSLKLPTHQLLDLAIVCRSYARKTFRGTKLANREDGFLVQALFDGRYKRRTAWENLYKQIRVLVKLTSLYTAPLLVCKMDVGFQPDNNLADSGNRQYSRFLTDLLSPWPECRRLILVDSVITRYCLEVVSRNQYIGKIRLVRTRIHCGDMCDHLVEPLYIKDHLIHTTPKKITDCAGWAKLLDTYGRTTDAASLKLLKKVMFACKTKYDTRVRRLYR